MSKLTQRVQEILTAYHSNAEPDNVIDLMKADGLSPGCLTQLELERDVRWTVMNRIEFPNDSKPSWRSVAAIDEDDFFE